MDEDKLEEDVTQVSNVDAGKIDIFGTKNDEEDWYEALYELKDWEEEDEEE